MSETTSLIMNSSEDDGHARSELLARIYPELRRSAMQHLRVASHTETISPTSLVGETYARLFPSKKKPRFLNRRYFFGAVKIAMTRVLVDRRRQRRRLVRNPGRPLQELRDSVAASRACPEQSVIMEDCLQELAGAQPRAAHVFTRKYLRGMTEAQIAAEDGVSERTVRRDIQLARAWLHAALGAAGGTGRCAE